MESRTPADQDDVERDFATYVEQRRPALLRAAHAITRDPDTAEDLLQAALAGVLPRWHTLRHHGAADAYVRRAMVNQHASWFRESWRTRERPTGEVPEPRTAVAVHPAAAVPDRRLWRLVATLPPRQRQTVVLRYYEGLTELETATVLRCSVGTVKSNTHRGLASLRRRAVGLDLDLVG
jgi:RNA polymerase sigma-70 factor (sigma-E family)